MTRTPVHADSRSVIRLVGACAASLVACAASAFAQASTVRVSLTSTGQQVNGDIRSAALSRDGRFLAFTSAATNVVPNDPSSAIDLYLREIPTGETRWVSTLPMSPYEILPDMALSADGRTLAFDLIVSGNHNQVVVYDWNTASLSPLSSGSSNDDAAAASISADGRYITYGETDSNGVGQVYRYDRATATRTLASVNNSGVPGNNDSGVTIFSEALIPLSIGTSVSDDGRYVAFATYATNMGGAAGSPSTVVVRDLQAGLTQVVNVDAAGQPVYGGYVFAQISGNGSIVAFKANFTNAPLLTGVPGNVGHLFARDLAAGTTELLTVTPGGAPSAGGNTLLAPALSTDGRYALFASNAPDLVAGDVGGLDVFLRDRATGTTTIASRAQDGSQSAGIVIASGAIGQSISGDASRVLFLSSSASVVPGDTNAHTDAFVRATAAAPAVLCAGDGTGAACPCGNSGAAGHGCASSANPNGAELAALGLASREYDSLALECNGSQGAIVLYFQSTLAQGGGAGVVLGDGLLCVAGSIIRLGQVQPVGGLSQYPGPGQQPVSVRGQIPVGGGVTRVYQARFRDPASFCTGETFNISNGIVIEWLP